jgi:hypothetical protein
MTESGERRIFSRLSALPLCESGVWVFFVEEQFLCLLLFGCYIFAKCGGVVHGVHG